MSEELKTRAVCHACASQPRAWLCPVCDNELAALKAGQSEADDYAAFEAFMEINGSVNEPRVMQYMLWKQGRTAPPAIMAGYADLDARMKAAGMISVADLLAGTPMDSFRKHAGVNDLATFGQWLDMKVEEYTKMQARFELDKHQDDELYDWVIAHTAVFSEVRINFKAASADAVSVPRELLERTIPNLLYGSARDNAEELRALLAQPQEVK